MKALFIALTIFSTLLTGCDRQTLDGLRLGFQADFKSDYEDKGNEPTSQTQPSQSSQPSQSTQLSQSSQPASQQEEKSQNQPVREVKSEPDPDQAPPFRPLEACSKGGIIAQANKIFYKKNPQVKSIDSKNKEQVNKWEQIHGQVEQKCSTSE